MTTDDIIQKFRMIDLFKLRRQLDKLQDTPELAQLTKFLNRCQRKIRPAVEAPLQPKRDDPTTYHHE